MRKLKTIRGMPDIFGKTLQKISFVEEVCRKTFHAHNFQEFRTPLLEDKDIFTRSVGETSDIVQKQMYEFQDKKGATLCLRPEGTVGLARALLTNGLDDSEIKKLFYIGPMFRYERPQKGRKRQFSQAGVELIADKSYHADLEVIQVGVKILKDLNVKFKLEINYVGDAQTLSEYREYLRDFLLKNKKKIAEEFYQRLQRNPLRGLDSKDDNIKAIFSKTKKLSDFLDSNQEQRFKSVINGLEALGIEYTTNQDLVRGLDYYTGTVFEFITDKLGTQNALIGGGRYDTLLMDLGGKKLPAVGFALGVDRLSELVNPPNNDKFLFIGSLTSESKVYGQKIGSILREIRPDVVIENYLGEANVGKQLKKASSLGFKFVMIIGQEELKSKRFKIKDLNNSSADFLIEENNLAGIFND
tara:strand:- start:939 stop:2180 length:1242 start_codon:yes stop_codon:yes gene_type:complete